MGGHVLHHLHKLSHRVLVAAGRGLTAGGLLLGYIRSWSRGRALALDGGSRLVLLGVVLEGVAL
jgi:hypothetical protein